MQTSPDQFAAHWNAAQAIAGVQLAVSANSPYLLGKELWRETRIPLFEQATDTRSEELKAQGVRPRVWFGERWITSVFDLFEENVRYFPALLPVTDDEDPLEVLESGGTPALHELKLHNGTIYRWNRPVYDISDGVPHLRVENRLLAAGPTIADTIANAALWFGLVRYLVESERPLWSQMSFSAAEENFHVAAQMGVDAQVYWPGLGQVRATELVLRRLLPMARAGSRLVGRPLGGERPLPRHHRAALPDRGERRRVVRRPRPRARGGGPLRRAPGDPARLHRAHAQQRARPHLGLTPGPAQRRAAGVAGAGATPAYVADGVEPPAAGHETSPTGIPSACAAHAAGPSQRRSSSCGLARPGRVSHSAGRGVSEAEARRSASTTSARSPASGSGGSSTWRAHRPGTPACSVTGKSRRSSSSTSGEGGRPQDGVRVPVDGCLERRLLRERWGHRSRLPQGQRVRPTPPQAAEGQPFPLRCQQASGGASRPREETPWAPSSSDTSPSRRARPPLLPVSTRPSCAGASWSW